MGFLWPDRVVIGGDGKSFRNYERIYGPLLKINSLWYTHSCNSRNDKICIKCISSIKNKLHERSANLCESMGASVKQVSKAMGQDGRISPSSYIRDLDLEALVF